VIRAVISLSETERKQRRPEALGSQDAVSAVSLVNAAASASTWGRTCIHAGQPGGGRVEQVNGQVASNYASLAEHHG
jgi:hypothetical protein